MPPVTQGFQHFGQVVQIFYLLCFSAVCAIFLVPFVPLISPWPWQIHEACHSCYDCLRPFLQKHRHAWVWRADRWARWMIELGTGGGHNGRTCWWRDVAKCRRLCQTAHMLAQRHFHTLCIHIFMHGSFLKRTEGCYSIIWLQDIQGGEWMNTCLLAGAGPDARAKVRESMKQCLGIRFQNSLYWFDGMIFSCACRLATGTRLLQKGGPMTKVKELPKTGQERAPAWPLIGTKLFQNESMFVAMRPLAFAARGRGTQSHCGLRLLQVWSNRSRGGVVWSGSSSW